MAGRIKVLVAERKQNKSKLQDLENQAKILAEKLVQADKKSSVTANVGKKRINEL